GDKTALRKSAWQHLVRWTARLGHKAPSALLSDGRPWPLRVGRPWPDERTAEGVGCFRSPLGCRQTVSAVGGRAVRVHVVRSGGDDGGSLASSARTCSRASC